MTGTRGHLDYVRDILTMYVIPQALVHSLPSSK